MHRHETEDNVRIFLIFLDGLEDHAIEAPAGDSIWSFDILHLLTKYKQQMFVFVE